MDYEDWSDVYIYRCPHCEGEFALDIEMNHNKIDKTFWCPYCRKELTGQSSEEI